MKFFARPAKKGATEEYCRIYARVRQNNADKKYALGFTILESEWDKYNKGRHSNSDWMESINISYGQFSKILREVKKLFESEYNPDTVMDDIKSIHDRIVFPEKVKETVPVIKTGTLCKFMQSHIDSLKEGRRLKKKKSTAVTDGYISILIGTLNKVMKYEEENGIVDFKNVNMKFHHDFIAWCREHGVSDNTIAGHFENLRMFMRCAFDQKLTMNTIHLNSDFVPARTPSDSVYLTKEQIEQMIGIDLETPEVAEKLKDIYLRMNNSDRKREVRITRMLKTMNKTRDIFIAGCLTGQRESDYMRFSKDMIIEMNGMKFLKFKQTKTQKTVIIPLDKRVEAILDKYRGKMPTVSKSMFNCYLHFLCEILGWTWKLNLDNADKKYKECERFCDLVSSHTARRSFATNAYTAGISISSIIAITGHAREEGLRRYLRMDATEKAIIADRDMEGFLQSADMNE